LFSAFLSSAAFFAIEAFNFEARDLCSCWRKRSWLGLHEKLKNSAATLLMAATDND